MLEVSWFHRFPSIIDIEHQPTQPVSRQAIQKDATAAPEDGDEEMNSMQSSGGAYVSPESRWDLWIWKWQPEASRGHGQLLLPPVKVYRNRMIQNVSKNTRLVVLEETSVMSQKKMVCFACFRACWSAEIPLNSLNSEAVDLATLARGTGKLPKKWMQVWSSKWWIWSKVSDLQVSTSHKIGVWNAHCVTLMTVYICIWLWLVTFRQSCSVVGNRDRWQKAQSIRIDEMAFPVPMTDCFVRCHVLGCDANKTWGEGYLCVSGAGHWCIQR